jgi:hypothetical protein
VPIVSHGVTFCDAEQALGMFPPSLVEAPDLHLRAFRYGNITLALSSSDEDHEEEEDDDPTL